MTSLMPTKEEHESMIKRKREIERMIDELGLTISSFRTDGSSHWRVDVRSPNGNQRPFTFSTSGHDGGDRRKAEEGMLRRWRREVAPEMDALEESGMLRGKRGTLADKLEKLHIPLKREDEPTLSPPTGISTMRTAPPREEPPFKKVTVGPNGVRHVPATPPAPAVTQPPKETPPVAQAQAPAPTATPLYTKRSLNHSEYFKLCTWIAQPDILKGCWSLRQAAERASKALGISVPESSVQRALGDTGAKMPDDAAMNTHRQRDRVAILAEEVMAFMSKMGEEPSERLKSLLSKAVPEARE